MKVSISHRYSSTTVFTAFHVFIIPYFYRFSIFFSKKVGQPLHSKFLQSFDSTGFFILSKLARRFTDFSAFFCCFQHLFMLFLSWRPWFYWVGGSPTFFTDFLTIFVLIKEKAPVLSQKLKPLLNISITPAIRPSPYIHALHLYSATRKISLSFGERPLTSYPGLRPSLHRNGYLQISPSIQIFPHCFCHTATFTGYFRYRRISPPSKQSALLALPLSYQLPHWYPLGLFLHRRRLLLHPEVPCN